jgi:hypothetical protein
MFSFSWATYLLCLHRMQAKILPLKLYAILDIYVYSCKVPEGTWKYMWYLHVLCTWLVDIPKLPNQNLGKSRSRHTIPKRGQKFYNVTWVRCQPNECQSLWTCVNFGLADFESQPISLFTFLSY